MSIPLNVKEYLKKHKKILKRKINTPFRDYINLKEVDRNILKIISKF